MSSAISAVGQRRSLSGKISAVSWRRLAEELRKLSFALYASTIINSFFSGTCTAARRSLSLVITINTTKHTVRSQKMPLYHVNDFLWLRWHVAVTPTNAVDCVWKFEKKMSLAARINSSYIIQTEQISLEGTILKLIRPVRWNIHQGRFVHYVCRPPLSVAYSFMVVYNNCN